MQSHNNLHDLIAITGCGSLSALGCDRPSIYAKYLSEETSLVNRNFNNHIYPVGVLPKQAEEKLISLIFKNQKYKKSDRVVLMAIEAAAHAFEEAGWKYSPGIITGVNIGSSRGSTTLFEQLHEDFLRDREKRTTVYTSPLTTLGYVSNLVSAHLCLNGPVISTSVTCSTGIQAICNAIAWIRSGMANRFLAGGAEAPLTRFTIAQVEALGIYSKLLEAKYPCAPLSLNCKNENTFALGEGAAVFALEKMNAAEVKDNKPLAVIESVGYSFEKPPTLTGIGEEGTLIASSMQMALDNMITDNPVDLILLHCPGTVKGDEAELNAVKHVFKSNPPNIYSNKWKIGHCYSASPALSLELAILCLQNNFSPVFPYPVAYTSHKRDIRKIMINATGFGGNATSIIVSHPGIME